MTNSVRTAINAEVNVKNWLIKCDIGFIWNPGICECERDKLCDIGEYLDYENCKCRKRLIDRIVEKCDEDINGNEMVYNSTLIMKRYASPVRYT